MRVTVSSPEFVTHTKRRPTKIPAGLEPTPIGLPTTAGEARSMRLTVLSLKLATHTSCLPSEIASGRSPTGTLAVGTTSPSAWKRSTVSEPALASHTTPLPATIPSGRVPAGSGSPAGSLLSASITDSVPPCWLATKTRPPLTATPSGPFPTGIVATALKSCTWGVAVAVAVGGGRRRSAVTVACGGARSRAAAIPAANSAAAISPIDEHGRQPDPERQPPPARPRRLGVRSLAADVLRPARRGGGGAVRERGGRGAGELAGGLVAVVGLLGHRLGDDRVERGRGVGAGLGDHRRRRGDVRVHLRHVGVLVVRQPLGQRLVEHAAERVDVGAGVHRPRRGSAPGRRSRPSRRTGRSWSARPGRRAWSGRSRSGRRARRRRSGRWRA